MFSPSFPSSHSLRASISAFFLQSRVALLFTEIAGCPELYCLLLRLWERPLLQSVVMTSLHVCLSGCLSLSVCLHVCMFICLILFLSLWLSASITVCLLGFLSGEVFCWHVFLCLCFSLFSVCHVSCMHFFICDSSCLSKCQYRCLVLSICPCSLPALFCLSTSRLLPILKKFESITLLASSFLTLTISKVIHHLTLPFLGSK